MTSDSSIEQAAREAERILGWKHLVKYAGMPQEWMDRTMRAIVRSVLAHQAPATEDDAAPLRTFELHRDEDESGISGTGVVVQGVVFADGKIAMRWIVGEHRSTVLWDSLDAVEAIHGHGGRTRLVWTDRAPAAEPVEQAIGAETLARVDELLAWLHETGFPEATRGTLIASAVRSFVDGALEEAQR